MTSMNSKFKSVVSSNWKQLKKSKLGVSKKSNPKLQASVSRHHHVIKTSSSSLLKVEKKSPQENLIVTSVEQPETDESESNRKKRDLMILEDILTSSSAAPEEEMSPTNSTLPQKEPLSTSLLSNDINANDKVGKYIAMDCEMVGVGSDGTRSMLARVTIVNYWGHVIMDEFVKPMEKVTDYRTWITGITPSMLKNGIPFSEIQKKVADIIKNRVVVGHGLINDFKVLLLSHPASMVRDTALYAPLRNQKTRKPRALRHLAKEILGIDIQTGAHSSVEDARAVMLLYQKYKVSWEAHIAKLRRSKTGK